VAATKGRSGNALTVRRRHGTGMGKSDATAERRRREGRTDNCARREREGEREGRAQERQIGEETGEQRQSQSRTLLRRRLLPSSSLPSLPSPLPLRIYTTSAQNKDCHILTTHHSLSIHPLLPHLISFSHCPHHSVCYGIDYNNIIIISAPVTRIHLSLHHETDRFVLSSRRAGIDHNTLCCINAPRQQGR
jgi:hypothetical protein